MSCNCSSVGIYLDTVNIFIRIAMILAGGGNRRKWTTWADETDVDVHLMLYSMVQKNWPHWVTNRTHYTLIHHFDKCQLIFKYLSPVDRLIEQGLTSHETHHRSYPGRSLWVKWPNRQCQSTEGSRGPKDQASIPPGPPHHVTVVQPIIYGNKHKNRVSSKFVITQSLNTPPHCKHIAHYLVNISGTFHWQWPVAWFLWLFVKCIVKLFSCIVKLFSMCNGYMCIKTTDCCSCQCCSCVRNCVEHSYIFQEYCVILIFFMMFGNYIFCGFLLDIIFLYFLLTFRF